MMKRPMYKVLMIWACSVVSNAKLQKGTIKSIGKYLFPSVRILSKPGSIIFKVDISVTFLSATQRKCSSLEGPI